MARGTRQVTGCPHPEPREATGARAGRTQAGRGGLQAAALLVKSLCCRCLQSASAKTQARPERSEGPQTSHHLLTAAGGKVTVLDPLPPHRHPQLSVDGLSPSPARAQMATRPQGGPGSRSPSQSLNKRLLRTVVHIHSPAECTLAPNMYQTQF